MNITSSQPEFFSLLYICSFNSHSIRSLIFCIRIFKKKILYTKNDSYLHFPQDIFQTPNLWKDKIISSMAYESMVKTTNASNAATPTL